MGGRSGFSLSGDLVGDDEGVIELLLLPSPFSPVPISSGKELGNLYGLE